MSLNDVPSKTSQKPVRLFCSLFFDVSSFRSRRFLCLVNKGDFHYTLCNDNSESNLRETYTASAFRLIVRNNRSFDVLWCCEICCPSLRPLSEKQSSLKTASRFFFFFFFFFRKKQGCWIEMCSIFWKGSSFIITFRTRFSSEINFNTPQKFFF